MTEKYLQELKHLLADSQTPKPPTAKTAKTNSEVASAYKLEKAHKLGLVASWSQEFGYVTIHDPNSGEWYDVELKDAPPWALDEASRRKDLYRSGNHRAYRPSSKEMERIWQEEHLPEPDFIEEEHPLPD